MPERLKRELDRPISRRDRGRVYFQSVAAQVLANGLEPAFAVTSAMVVRPGSSLHSFPFCMSSRLCLDSD